MNSEAHNTLSADVETARRKYEALCLRLRELGSLAVAFSGGVDSTFLLEAAHQVLGDRVIAVTAVPAFVPRREQREAADFCRERGIRQIVVSPDRLRLDAAMQNPPDRCYLCKREIFRNILDVAHECGIAFVAEGSNVDDTGDYRPGMRAIRELGVLSPLLDAGLNKQEIRLLSRQLDLPTWAKPSFACLASRFVYGEAITDEKLRAVEQAEDLLLGLGFTQMRVRVHGPLARIELLPEDLPRLTAPDLRGKIVSALREYGFSYVTLDLQGYRTGSMNELLDNSR